MEEEEEQQQQKQQQQSSLSGTRTWPDVIVVVVAFLS